MTPDKRSIGLSTSILALAAALAVPPMLSDDDDGKVNIEAGGDLADTDPLVSDAVLESVELRVTPDAVDALAAVAETTDTTDGAEATTSEPEGASSTVAETEPGSSTTAAGPEGSPSSAAAQDGSSTTERSTTEAGNSSTTLAGRSDGTSSTTRSETTSTTRSGQTTTTRSGTTSTTGSSSTSTTTGSNGTGTTGSNGTGTTQSTTTTRPTTTTTRPTTTTSEATTTTTPSGGAVYHVDCGAGRDSNDGRTAQTAVRTLTRASNLALRPGDSLLLKRGCTWSGGQRLDAGWNGTSGNPITIGGYGSGDRPRIVDGLNQGIKVTGSHMVITGVHVTFNVSETRNTNGCVQPFGDYYGVNFTGGANNVLLTDSLMERANAGVHISANSSSITVQGNVLRNNDVMNVWGGNPALDLGAWGVLLRSNDNNVSFNQFTNNRAPCANGIGRIHSNSVEIFEGARNDIHHNRSNDRVFSELGGSASEKAADNRFEFNLHSSNMVDARFITTRGGGSVWGPVLRTIVEHNTVNLTGSGSIAISCGEGCNANILRLRGNILIGADKPLFADANFDEADNVYWHPGGATRLQVAGQNRLYDPGTEVFNGSIVANPQLNGSQRPAAGGPAINRADSSQPRSSTDLAGNGPIGTRDSGAFEVS